MLIECTELWVFAAKDTVFSSSKGIFLLVFNLTNIPRCVLNCILNPVTLSPGYMVSQEILSSVTRCDNKASYLSTCSSAGRSDHTGPMMVPRKLDLTIALSWEPDQTGVRCLIQEKTMWHCHSGLGNIWWWRQHCKNNVVAVSYHSIYHCAWMSISGRIWKQ